MTLDQSAAPFVGREAPASSARTKAKGFAISYELIAYVLLAVVALVLRLAELDTVPLSAPEAHNALSAWRAISPEAAGAGYTPTSQIVFLAQTLAFSLFGASEFSARFLTALAGGVLVLTPSLFRDTLGAGRALALSILLAASPVLLIASRESAEVVWAALFAVGLLWSVRCWLRSREQDALSDFLATLAAICGAAMLFLCGASGVVLSAILAVGIVGASLWSRFQDEEPAEPNSSAYLLEMMRLFPWGSALLAAVAVLVVAATSFLIYPTGLSSVGSAFSRLVELIAPTSPTSAFRTLFISLFYEPHLWLLGIAAVVLSLRANTTFADRFFVVTAVAGAAAGVIFGGVPANALWLTLPLAGLASGALIACFVPDTGVVFLPAPSWARWLVAVGLVGALAVFTIAAQSGARAMLAAGDGLLGNVSFPGDAIVLLFVSTMFIVIGFFLFSSLWGARTTWQGIGLGVAVFFCLTSLGSGWSVAVADSDQPAQAWRNQATGDDTALLRQTLLELTDRESRGFPGLPVYVMADEDSVVAWVLRDFTHTTFIQDLGLAVTQGVVLLPASLQSPDLGTAYVGEDFVIQRSWSLVTMDLIDFPAFWTQRLARVPSLIADRERYVLWLRQDIYDGTAKDSSGAVG